MYVILGGHEMKRKILAYGLITSMLVGTLAGCGISDSAFDVQMDGSFGKMTDDSEDKFYIYSCNDELQSRLEYVYEVYPELRDKIEYVNVGDAEMYPYSLDVARDKRNGNIKGLSWQSCPGAFMYRADLAKKYLGVNSPEQMQARISTWDDFLAVGEELKEKSGDSLRILSSNLDIKNVFTANKSLPWVDNNDNLNIDDSMIEYLEVANALEQQDLTWKTGTWTDEWSKDAASDRVFGYFGCTWFLHWTIKSNCGATFNDDGSVDTSQPMGTYGKWNMCQGPMPYYWGGTWLGATAECSDKEIAGKIMKTLCCNTDVMTKLAGETMDYVNNKKAMKTLADQGKGTYEFLGGQDYINAFLPLADDVDVSWMCAYDETLNDLFEVYLQDYQKGGKEIDDTLNEFKNAVRDTFPRLNVK